MNSLIAKIISTERLVKPSQVLGEIPSPKKAYKTAFDMALPATVESVLVGVIGIVDTIMVASLGDYAIAAVGITNQPRLILMALFISLNIGVTAIVARRRGENDAEGARRCLRQAILICIILSLFISGLGIYFSRSILLFAGAQPDTIDSADIYFKILSFGILFQSLNLVINAAQRGAGNTKIAMRTNIVANLVNVVFNYLLIGGNFGFPRLEVAGAAIATVIGFIVALVLAIRSVLVPDGFLYFSFKQKGWYDADALKSIYKVGGSAALEQLFMRVGMFTFVKVVAGLGTVAFATHQIGMNTISLSYTFGDGLGVAAAALVGQNMGRKRPDLSIVYGKVCQRMATVTSVGLSLFFVTLRYPLVSLYSDSPEVINAAANILLFIAVITFSQTAQVVYTGCLRGAGDTKFIAITSMFSIAILRPTIAYVLCYHTPLGVYGAWIGLGTDQFLRMFFAQWRFSSGKWTKIKI